MGLLLTAQIMRASVEDAANDPEVMLLTLNTTQTHTITLHTSQTLHTYAKMHPDVHTNTRRHTYISHTRTHTQPCKHAQHIQSLSLLVVLITSEINTQRHGWLDGESPWLLPHHFNDLWSRLQPLKHSYSRWCEVQMTVCPCVCIMCRFVRYF